MMKSLDSPIPLPKIDSDIPAIIGGKPPTMARGNTSAPSRATAGVGQMNQERISMAKPITQ